MRLPPAYQGELEQVQIYWSVYGGTRKLLGSAYVALALIWTAACAPLWMHGEWWDTVLTTLPNVLGFSLSGYAILLAFGDDRFRRTLAGTDPAKAIDQDNSSPYLKFSATFMHFILVQVLAILVAVLAKSHPLSWFSQSLEGSAIWPSFRAAAYAFGFWLFAYALTSALAATVGIFRMVKLYDLKVWYGKKEDEARQAIEAMNCGDDVSTETPAAPAQER